MSSDDIAMGKASYKIKDYQGTLTGDSKVDVTTGLSTEMSLAQHLTMKVEVGDGKHKFTLPTQGDTQIRMVIEPR